MLRSQPGVVCTGLDFAWPDGSPIFSHLSFAIGPGRTGIVAPNGSGKSTLLRLIAGELRPTAGSVAVRGALGYLPQTLPLAANRTVADILGATPVLAALRAIEAGETDAAHFAAIGDEWDVEERIAAALGRLGLADVAPQRTVASLSGGQTMAVGLAAQLLRKPDVLLLDEPSNNLDLDARERLYAVIAGWQGALLIASHDRELLDRVDLIAELHPDEIRLYGGNFAVYETTVIQEQRSAEQSVRTAEQQFRREKREMQEARERSDRRASAGKRQVRAGGMPKIAAGGLQRKAEVSSGRASDLHERRLDAARARLERERHALRDDRRIRIALPETRVPTGRVLFEASDAVLTYPGGVAPFGQAGLALTIRGPERIALLGSNGSGKSTLLRAIAGNLAPDAGIARQLVDAGAIRALPQTLDLLDEEQSVLSNLCRYAPSAPDTELRARLAGFLFIGEQVHLPVGDLSGGERLRATLACLLSAEPAPQLFLLDEPTNNLDLVSVAQLEQALAVYEGALVVASHDLPFLANIGITRWLHLVPGATPAAADPPGTPSPPVNLNFLDGDGTEANALAVGVEASRQR
ncbi:MAG: ABC-F family ATP-binding cassette domain-containing protein [Thermomicrobiales bacterium]|nr:ABC-F family ATP-binding cassette domain-containing protein [Thermomicrobiales bacterium]